MTQYFRPLVQHDLTRPKTALPVAGASSGWFSHVEVLSRVASAYVVPVSDVPSHALEMISKPRSPICGLDMGRAQIMGILNVTPDSFSDGGQHEAPAQAVLRGRQLVSHGADILDIGGESTRPGAQTVTVASEVARTEPVIAALRHFVKTPISIDTRKAGVAEAAISAGADLVNDVSGFTYDKSLTGFCARKETPVCVMHAQGDPETMQNNPRYDDVLLDVYDFLAAQVVMLTEAGISPDRIIVDPGIGFGKVAKHNLALLNRISLFHSLGCPVLLGASRKKFIGTISGVTAPLDRIQGSVSVAITAALQGVQFLRVHDVRETRQALDLLEAVQRGS